MDGAEHIEPGLRDKEGVAEITERERKILRLVFDGVCTREAAEILGVSKRTVDSHLSTAYDKLGADNRFQAYKRAVELGII